MSKKPYAILLSAIVFFLLLLPSLVIGQDKELISKARSGDPQAQFELGGHYFKSKAYSRAVRMWTQAAKGGNVSAQNNLAGMYQKGLGVQKDLGKAIEWWTKAAEEGHPKAQYMMGLFYASGQDAKGQEVPKDLAKSIELWTKAAAQGHEKAQQKLAEMRSLDKRKRKYEEIKRIEDSYVTNNILDKRYSDNCARYYTEAKLGGEKTRCLNRAISINKEELRKAKEKIRKTKEKQRKIKEKIRKTKENIRKYEEIKRIEDSYVTNNILDKRYSDNCARYYTEARMGGEKIRCLKRVISILKSMKR